MFFEIKIAETFVPAILICFFRIEDTKLYYPLTSAAQSGDFKCGETTKTTEASSSASQSYRLSSCRGRTLGSSPTQRERSCHPSCLASCRQ